MNEVTTKSQDKLQELKKIRQLVHDLINQATIFGGLNKSLQKGNQFDLEQIDIFNTTTEKSKDLLISLREKIHELEKNFTDHNN